MQLRCLSATGQAGGTLVRGPGAQQRPAARGQSGPKGGPKQNGDCHGAVVGARREEGGVIRNDEQTRRRMSAYQFPGLVLVSRFRKNRVLECLTPVKSTLSHSHRTRTLWRRWRRRGPEKSVNGCCGARARRSVRGTKGRQGPKDQGPHRRRAGAKAAEEAALGPPSRPSCSRGRTVASSCRLRPSATSSRSS